MSCSRSSSNLLFFIMSVIMLNVSFIPIHHSCRSHAIKTAFISSANLLRLSIHLTVVPVLSTSWYQYPFSLDVFLIVSAAETWAAMLSSSLYLCHLIFMINRRCPLMKVCSVFKMAPVHCPCLSIV